MSLILIIFELFAVWIYKVLVYFDRVLQRDRKEYWQVNI
jgi:hypothetical protein